MVKEKFFQLIEHTADLGIRVSARDLKTLFTKSARAMFCLIAQRRAKTDPKKQKVKNFLIKQKGEDLEELFVSWLNELLSLSATKAVIFEKFRILKLDNRQLKASVSARPVADFYVDTEIKAATYHALKLEKKAYGWQAEVIFDV